MKATSKPSCLRRRRGEALSPERCVVERQREVQSAVTDWDEALTEEKAPPVPAADWLGIKSDGQLARSRPACVGGEFAHQDGADMLPGLEHSDQSDMSSGRVAGQPADRFSSTYGHQMQHRRADTVS